MTRDILVIMVPPMRRQLDRKSKGRVLNRATERRQYINHKHVLHVRVRQVLSDRTANTYHDSYSRPTVKGPDNRPRVSAMRFTLPVQSCMCAMCGDAEGLESAFPEDDTPFRHSVCRNHCDPPHDAYFNTRGFGRSDIGM